MTILYEVETGHSSKVLKGFAGLYNEKTRNNKKILFRYMIAAAILLTVPKAFNVSDIERLLCWGAGGIVAAMGLFRNQLSYLRLLYQDPYYRNGVKIKMWFGHSAFEVQDGGKEKVTYKYNLVTDLYADEAIYYLHMENDDLFAVPKDDFVSGDPEKFYDFMQNAARKEFEGVNLSLKQRFYKKRIEMAEAGMENNNRKK